MTTYSVSIPNYTIELPAYSVLSPFYSGTYPPTAYYVGSTNF